jgi:hypothetical protein
VIRTVSISRTRIAPRDEGKTPARARRGAAAATRARGGAGVLEARRAEPADIPWIESWAASLGLPGPTSRGVMAFVLLKDAQRIGYLAARDQLVDTARGREPMRWIVSAFLVPAARGQGLLMRFGELLSRQVYPQGKIGARIATHNARMLKLMRMGGWTRLRTTRQYVDFTLDLRAPFRSGRGGTGG